MVPFVIVVLRDYPADRGVRRVRRPGRTQPDPPPPDPAGAVQRAVRALRDAARTRTFWALAGGFAICGATTNGLIGTHFIPSAHDHGMAETTAAGLLALVGIFDIVGTIVSGALTDKIDPRILLVGYYFFRGVGLLVLPLAARRTPCSPACSSSSSSTAWTGWPPCRRPSPCAGEAFGANGTIVFGWVFASHQIGAAIAAGGGRHRPRHHRRVHHRLVRRGRALRGGRRRLVRHPPHPRPRSRLGYVRITGRPSDRLCGRIQRPGTVPGTVFPA